MQRRKIFREPESRIQSAFVLEFSTLKLSFKNKNLCKSGGFFVFKRLASTDRSSVTQNLMLVESKPVEKMSRLNDTREAKMLTNKHRCGLKKTNPEDISLNV